MKRYFFRLRTILIVLVVVVTGGIFYCAAAFRGMKDTVERELRMAREDAGQLARNFELLSQDTNEARMALGLSPRVYSGAEDTGESGGGGEAGRGGAALAYYQAVELLVSQAEKNERARRFAAVFASGEVAAFQARGAYRIRQSDGVLVWEKERNPWFRFYVLNGDADFEALSFRGTKLSFRSADAAFVRFLGAEEAALSEYFRNVRQLSRQFADVLREPVFARVLQSRELGSSVLSDTEKETVIGVFPVADRQNIKLRLGFDKQNSAFLINDTRYSDFASFRGALSGALENLDLRRADEILIAQARQELEELFEDQGFTAYLGTKNLILDRTPNEDEEYIYYDFHTNDGKRAGSLGIQKRVGEIYLFDEDYVSLGSLKTIGLKNNSEGAKKKQADTERFSSLPGLPDGSAAVAASEGAIPGSVIHTILIAGSHERMTDTLILANIHEEKNTIDLISLPRDLFYRNRKINGIYYRYGAPRLVEELSGLTGLDINEYVVIDMFAFIDAINILGGIDITLNEALVDPTYRVRDNGRWSTLFYSAGTHHLNGVEALRVVRSRHFTSDFGRSRRQQNILASIKDKMTSLGVSDVGKVYELVRILTKYVDTNLSTYQMVNYFINYKSAKIRSQTVLDTDNVLTHSYTNLRHLNLKEEEVDETFDKGAYILLPLNEDWMLLRRFIRSILEGPVA
ncbi:MAG: LCP family protein [Spirochaetales bacterium]|jgi:LCP family protein required for cell wall assembly|nr:LCP family protein [Spirochaetales bacterium]